MARVLIATGHPDVRTVTRRILEVGGHQVFVAADVEHALMTLEVRSVDLLVLGHHLAISDDARVMAWCQDSGQDIPIILLTSHRSAMDEGVLQSAWSSSYVDFLEKPFGRTELNRVVERALEKRRDSGPTS